MSNLHRGVSLFLALSLPAIAQDYQLTGIIAASDGGKAFAVIEQADGAQRLLSEGDSLGNGRVATIDTASKTVRLALPGGDLLLTLDGSAFPEDIKTPYLIQDYEDGMGQFELKQDTVDAIIALAAKARSLGEMESSRRLNELLDLSKDDRIAAFNEQQVDSTIQVVEELADQLRGKWRGSHVGTLSVAGTEGGHRIYLHRDDPNAMP